MWNYNNLNTGSRYLVIYFRVPSNKRKPHPIPNSPLPPKFPKWTQSLVSSLGWLSPSLFATPTTPPSHKETKLHQLAHNWTSQLSIHTYHKALVVGSAVTVYDTVDALPSPSQHIGYAPPSGPSKRASAPSRASSVGEKTSQAKRALRHFHISICHALLCSSPRERPWQISYYKLNLGV